MAVIECQGCGIELNQQRAENAAEMAGENGGALLCGACRDAADLRRAIAAHRAAIERIGTVNVADDESRRRAEAKHAADQTLWQQAGRR